MADDIDIRNGLKTRLLTIPSLAAYNHIPGAMITSPAAACVSRRGTKFDVVMGDGADDWEYAVTVFIPYTDPELAQAQMSDYVKRTGPTSIKAAIEGEKTLGGVVDFAHVREALEEEIRQVGGVPHLAVEFVIEITG